MSEDSPIQSRENLGPALSEAENEKQLRYRVLRHATHGALLFGVGTELSLHNPMASIGLAIIGAAAGAYNGINSYRGRESRSAL